MKAAFLLALVCVLFLSACSPDAGSEGSSEISEAECSDGRDNDADGLVDCEDPACGVHAWCEPHPDAGQPDGGDDGGVDADEDVIPNDGDTSSAYCSIDIVFVIDVSTSMRDEVEGIRTGIDSVWAAARALTTDTRFGLVVFVDDHVAVNGCAPFDSVESLQSEFERWRDFTSSNDQPGGAGFSNSDCPENSIDALYSAATTCVWREEATRIVIHVTDDTFVERPRRLSSLLGMGGIAVQHTYDEVLSAMLENEIRVGAFAAPGAGEFCGAGTSPNVGQGFHESYNDQPSLPEATGGRAFNIRDVRAGSLDMAAAINELIEEEYCTPYVY